jgi:hypothetical protein
MPRQSITIDAPEILLDAHASGAHDRTKLTQAFAS